MLNEPLLVKRLQAGDNKAFQELISEFEPRLSRAAKLLTINEQEAKELVSDTLADTFFSIKRFRQESTLFSWLYSILLNKFHYQVGRRKRDVTLEASFQHITKEAVTPDRNKEVLNLFRQYLPSLIGSLSPEHREVILLKYLEGMKVKDMARILKIPESTVSVRLHRARINLREILKKSKLL